MSRDFWRHCWLAFTSRGPYDPTGRDQELARLRAERRELRAALDNLHGLAATQSRDMAQHRFEAWLYGALVGWERENECDEPWNDDHACDGAMLEVAEKHDWSDDDVEALRRFRRAIAHITGGAS